MFALSQSEKKKREKKKRTKLFKDFPSSRYCRRGISGSGQFSLSVSLPLFGSSGNFNLFPTVDV